MVRHVAKIQEDICKCLAIKGKPKIRLYLEKEKGRHFLGQRNMPGFKGTGKMKGKFKLE